MEVIERSSPVAEVTIVPADKPLTVVERVQLALNTAEREKTLVALAAASKSITSITNKDGRQQCHASRMALKNTRLEITRVGKAARDDANKFASGVIDEEERLIALITDEEERLQKLQDAWDADRLREKQEAEAVEQRRVDAIRMRVADLLGPRALSSLTPSALIAEHIAKIDSIAIDDTFQEFEAEAADAKASGLTWLRELLDAALGRETEQERLRVEREALQRQQQEQNRQREEEQRQAREGAQLNEMRMQEIQGLQHQAMIAVVGRAGVRSGGTRDCIVDTLAETVAWRITEEEFGPLTGVAQSVKDAVVTQIRAELTKWDQAAEATRIAGIRERIDNFYAQTEGATLLSAARVQLLLEAANAFVVDDTFAEFRREAQASLEKTRVRLAEIHFERQTFEAEEQRLATQRAEITRVAGEQREAQEAADRRIAAERAEHDAQQERERVAREAEEQRIADARAALERQQDEFRAEQERAAAPPPPPPDFSTVTDEAAPDDSPQESLALGPAVESDPWRPTDGAIVHLLSTAYDVDAATVVAWLRAMNLDAVVVA